jgi:hypothetical protein
LANNDHQLTQPLETYLSTLNHLCEQNTEDRLCIQGRPREILEHFHSKMEEESFDGKDEAILNLGKIVDVIKQFQNIDNDKNKHKSDFFQTFGSVIDALAGNDVKHGLPKHAFDTDKSKPD